MNFSEFYASNYFYIVYFVLLLYIIYKLSTWTFNLDKEIGISGPKPVPFFGNIFEYMKHGFHVCDVKYQRKYGHIYPVYLGQVGMLIASDQAIIRQVLVKDSKLFTDRPAIKGLSKLMKRNVAVLKDKDWERVRALLTPLFTSGKLKQMCPIIMSSVNDMMTRFKKVETATVDMRELFNSLTMDTIARAMFGIEINVTDNSHSFIIHVRKLFSLSASGALFTFISIFPQIGSFVDYWFPNGLVSPASEVYLQETLKKTIAARRQAQTEYHDFLALMIKAHDELSTGNLNSDDKSKDSGYVKLTEEEIMAQSIIFLFAGYETTGLLLIFCTYYLSNHPNVQEELYEEIMEYLGNEKEITHDMLGHFNLMDQCINETLRICPPAIRFGRVCTTDTELITSTGKIIHVKKGMEVMIPVYAIHHDEMLWENPEEFDIHRFDKDKRQHRAPYAFIPFGAGPRNCIGMRFALLEVKLALGNIIKNYFLLPCDQTLNKVSYDATNVMTIKHPVNIRVKKR